MTSTNCCPWSSLHDFLSLFPFSYLLLALSYHHLNLVSTTHQYTVMSGHPVNNLYTSFGRQAKNHDNNTPSAPASLPSVPSFGTLQSIPSFGTIPSVNSFGNEEWCNFHFNRFADASTTSASPFSPYSPGFASGASSVVGVG